jgi:hypothetical protein
MRSMIIILIACGAAVISMAAMQPFQEEEVAVSAFPTSSPLGEVSLWQQQGLSDGATLRASLLLADGLLDGEDVRPASVSLQFLWRQGLMGSVHALRKAGATSSEPLVFDLQGLSSEPHDPESDASGRSYHIVVEPIEGIVWGAVQNEDQVMIHVVVGE